jgi:hypothetical protein
MVAGAEIVAGADCAVSLAAGVRVARRARVATGVWLGTISAVAVAGLVAAGWVAAAVGAEVGLAGGLPSVQAITAAQTNRLTPSRLKLDIPASDAETSTTQVAL